MYWMVYAHICTYCIVGDRYLIVLVCKVYVYVGICMY